MAKLIKPDGSMTDVDPDYQEGFLPSDIAALVGGEELQFISLNSELALIITSDHAELEKNENATRILQKILGDPHQQIGGPALLVDRQDLDLDLFLEELS